MYKILMDGELLYTPSMLKEGYAVLEPKIIKEMNAAGSCEMRIPPTNPLYDSVRKLKSVVQVFDGSKEIFRGRCVQIDKDFRRNKSVYFEGCMSYLCDSVVMPYEYTNVDITTYISRMLNVHNGQADEDKKIYKGNIYVGGTMEKVSSTDYPSTMEELQKKVLDVFGGFFRMRYSGNKAYLDYMDERTTQNTQEIEFGKNLLDLDESIKCNEIYTAIIPLGKSSTDTQGRTTYLTISSVNYGAVMIVDYNAVNNFGMITKKVLFPEIEDASELYARGYMELQKNIKESVSITVSAIDMHFMDPEVDAFEIGDSVRIKSAPHGIDDDFPCSHLVINMTEPEKSSYTFGAIKRAITRRK